MNFIAWVLIKIVLFNKVNSDEENIIAPYTACFEQLYNYTVFENLPNLTAVIRMRASKNKKVEFYVAEKACRLVSISMFS